MALPDKSTTNGFPHAYMSTADINDPMMKRVDVTKGEIGSRTSGMPKDVGSEGMGIEHVGGTAGRKS